MGAPIPTDLKRVDPRDAWQPWAPDSASPFDARWAAHLYRRAAFGATPDEITRAVADGLPKTLDSLFHGDPRATARVPLLDELGDSIARSGEAAELRVWWLTRILQGGHPLREKVTLFWHNHFATSIAKVRSTERMLRQNQLLRTHALGKFGALLTGISRDPAMLVWLDSNQNVKAHPNENFAREVMELFTLGVGNYTEKDVREAARAFTGWSVNGGDEFERREAVHDDGPKTLLGQSGRFDGDDVLRILLGQPACGRFLAAKLYREFVSEADVPAAILEPLAEQFRTTGYDIAAVVRTILSSRLFFSGHAYRQRIKSPVEYVLGAVRAGWPGPIVASDLVGHLERMGQALFAPPNVKGWVGGKRWINDATLLARHNFADLVASGQRPVKLAEEPDEPKLGKKELPDRNPDDRPLEIEPREVTPGSSPKAEDKKKAAFKSLPSDELGGGKPVSPPKEFQEPPVPALDSAWYVNRRKATTPAEIVAAIGQQFFPERLPARVSVRLTAFLGPAPVRPSRVREAVHAVLCLPEYQVN